jgi:RND family efflux transporter MFP subunit
MKLALPRGRGWAVIAVLAPVLALLGYVALRSGPLAPVLVTTTTVQSEAIQPALFGIGTVEARRVHRIGPTAPGRLLRLDVDVGDTVVAGQLLGEMDPVDLEDRLRAQASALERALATVREARARREYATSQAQRTEILFDKRMVSEDAVLARRQELAIADAALAAASGEQARIGSDLAGLRAQRGHLLLRAPADGIVTRREVEAGTTVVAGQAVFELIDPDSLWVNARLDQVGATGLVAGLNGSIRLRSRGETLFSGRVERIEPVADSVTEEILAKIVFDSPPVPPPPIGELAEVTIELPTLAAAPTIPNAAIRRIGGSVGVWRVGEDGLAFVATTLGRGDLDGRVQVLRGLRAGDAIVLHSDKEPEAGSRFTIVERIPGVSR